LTAEQKRVALGVFAGIFLFMVIVAIMFYVYYALCLYFIAKKTAVEPAWLAWIPIANAFLMCKIADVSYLWLLGLLVQFIPIISILGAIYGFLLFIYLWYKIILLRNKPVWLVILMFVPIANLVAMGYLAFSE
jgi:magnesium-transporting ATPase (P-type)